MNLYLAFRLISITNELLEIGLLVKYCIKVDHKYTKNTKWNFFSALTLRNMAKVRDTEVICDKFNVVEIYISANYTHISKGTKGKFVPMFNWIPRHEDISVP
jgi:hypothetical protein